MRLLNYLFIALLLAGCASGTSMDYASLEKPDLPTKPSVDPTLAARSTPLPKALNYAGKVRHAITPHIYYPQSFIDALGPLANPIAEVEVRTSPDGKIVAKRLLKSSGIQTWDGAVLRALEAAGSIPLDQNGRVPSVLVLAFQLKQAVP